MANELPELVVANRAAWRRWLGRHHAEPGVWVVLARKGVAGPTTLTYDEALEEAICHGWIDGQAGRRDEATYRQRFTPRRSRSRWSQRNVQLAERLVREGRMHGAGAAEMDRAKADGRWDQAYASPGNITVPQALAAALRAQPRAQAMFDILSAQNRYAILYRIANAKREETKSRLTAQFVEMLARGETPHPQRRSLDS